MKLKKISVKNFIETLTDKEMKATFGGYGDGGGGYAFEIELPEVTVTCSSGGEGRCYACECNFAYVKAFPIPLPYKETSPYWTGYQTDYCIGGLPC